MIIFSFSYNQNNYTNKIHEYVIDWESYEWFKFYDGIMSTAGELDLENDNEDESAEKILDMLYEVVDNAAAKHLKKKNCF